MSNAKARFLADIDRELCFLSDEMASRFTHLHAARVEVEACADDETELAIDNRLRALRRVAFAEVEVSTSGTPIQELATRSETPPPPPELAQTGESAAVDSDPLVTFDAPDSAV